MLRSKIVAVAVASLLIALPLHAAEISEGQIAQAKAVLELRPDQERLWPRVASAIRNFSRETNQAPGGSTYQTRTRLEASAAKRVLSAAQPLLKTMTLTQRQSASALVRRLGFTDRGERL